jgi:crotonobetainyl-CoA:carnitine CoA-transferase CaiB-like acyl-CoA transferase
MTDAELRPFDGLRVLDLTHVVAGPFCAYQLALLGAETIKIEKPGEGDVVRRDGSDAALNAAGMGTLFLGQNANKRCVSLDISKPGGKRVLGRLVERADVLIENYRAGALDALGVGYDWARTINPRLIYCSMTAFGQTGPKASDNAYDQIVQAMSGVMSLTGTPATAPVKVGAPIMDYASGLSAAFAISAAIHQRSRTGLGQRIDCAMLDSALTLMGFFVTGYLHNGAVPVPRGNALKQAASSAYPTADGELMLGGYTPRQIERLWNALDRPDLAARSSLADQDTYREEIADALRAILKTRSAAAWETFFNAIGVPAARIRSFEEALAEEQLRTRALFQRFEQVDAIGGGPLTVPTAPFAYEHGGPRIDTPPRALGADTADVLVEIGYSQAEINALARDVII